MVNTLIATKESKTEKDAAVILTSDSAEWLGLSEESVLAGMLTVINSLVTVAEGVRKRGAREATGRSAQIQKQKEVCLDAASKIHSCQTQNTLFADVEKT